MRLKWYHYFLPYIFISLILLVNSSCYSGTMPEIIGANSLKIRLQGDTDITLPISGNLGDTDYVAVDWNASLKTATGGAGWVDWDLSAVLPDGTRNVYIQSWWRTESMFVGARKNGISVDAKISQPAYNINMIISSVGTDKIVEVYSFDSGNTYYGLIGYW